MEWGVFKSKGHQSVFDKALTIFQERTKNLKVAEQEIEKERIQSNKEHKYEQRKVQEDLFNMTKDKRRFAREARNNLQNQLPSIINRDKTYQGWTLREKQRLLRSFNTVRSEDMFPAITCTDANIPAIMKRSISKESQFHNWLIGLPRIRDPSVKRRTFRNTKLVKRDAGNKNDKNSDARAAKKHSRVENIVFNVPLSLRDTKIAAEKHYEASSRRLRKKAIVMIAAQDWNSRKGKLPTFKDTK